MNEVFKLAENIRINSSYLKKTRQSSLSYIGPAIWNRILEILKKTKNLNSFKHKMRNYYLNDLFNPNLWNIGGFDYALAS